MTPQVAPKRHSPKSRNAGFKLPKITAVNKTPKIDFRQSLNSEHHKNGQFDLESVNYIHDVENTFDMTTP